MGDDVEVAVVPGGCRIDEAQRPLDIPGGGWFAVLQRIGRSLSRDDVWLRSAGVAFNALFAAIPIAAVVVSVVGLLADPQTVHDPVERLGGLLPSHVSQFLADQMQGIAVTSRIHLGAGLGGATFAALWGAWSGASGLIAALTLAYREVETRSFCRRSCHAFLVAFGAGVFIVLAFALVALLPTTLDRLSADPGWSPTARHWRDPPHRRTHRVVTTMAHARALRPIRAETRNTLVRSIAIGVDGCRRLSRVLPRAPMTLLTAKAAASVT